MSDKVNEFVFGGGHVFVGNFNREGQHGILISHSEKSHGIGDKNPEWHDGKPYQPEGDDVLLMASSLEGARVLQEMVNGMCLIMNGYEVTE